SLAVEAPGEPLCMRQESPPATEESRRWPSCLPPSEHPQRPEGHPPRGLPRAIVDVEPHPPRRAPVQRPGAVLQAPGANVVDRVPEPRVGGSAGQGPSSSEVVECPEHVVAPSIRVEEQQESLVGQLTRAETANERPLQ